MIYRCMEKRSAQGIATYLMPQHLSLGLKWIHGWIVATEPCDVIIQKLGFSIKKLSILRYPILGTPHMCIYIYIYTCICICIHTVYNIIYIYVCMQCHSATDLFCSEGCWEDQHSAEIRWRSGAWNNVANHRSWCCNDPWINGFLSFENHHL